MSCSTGSAIVTPRGATSLGISRVLDAPRETVWDVHHLPEYVSRWWGLEGHENHITEIDLRPGGRWRFGQRGADGSEVIFGGVYRQIDPPNSFSYTKGWPGGDPAHDGLEESVITIVFDEHDGRTTVTLICDFPSSSLRDRVASTGMERLQQSYDRMDKLLHAISDKHHI
ncbi:SRPBCC domain-containing protein [Sinomonas sp. JGH33]|uniref:SRPBCC domain-containing protein n=1 Tax=Sinomonas terricola TaxID=3110330 RepID=A0ABU5T9D1_9MICC|nr:SRPBCC domain-containing protein [Sinomonas sp. JGH33]MEA5456302.1 SRPBCC domain-containing protein [Sinomonas sp. JGH33]